MARKRHTPDEIVAKLRQADVLVAQGQAVAHFYGGGSDMNQLPHPRAHKSLVF